MYLSGEQEIGSFEILGVKRVFFGIDIDTFLDVIIVIDWRHLNQV